MSKIGHSIYIGIFVIIVAATLIFLTYYGYTYYNTSLQERFFNPLNENLKPSGLIGHGLGIIGSLLILIGVFSYMIRKRRRALMRLGILKHWLEMHIFLCTLGPVLILYHTAFKFGGLVAISFWSMVAVFLSGIIGRFIYLQIPRSIEGRELSLSEVKDLKTNAGDIANLSDLLDAESMQVILDSTRKKVGIYKSNVFSRYFSRLKEDRLTLRNVRNVLEKSNIGHQHYKNILKLVKNEIALNRKIDRLVTMQNLFKYWHVAHLPFALIMLVIMVVHVVVTVTFGFRWIF